MPSSSRLISSLGAVLFLLLACSAHASRLLLLNHGRSLQNHGRRLQNHTSGPFPLFPYRECNTTNTTHPWQARLAYQEDRQGDTRVTIRVWASHFNHAVSLNNLDLYVPVESDVRKFQQRLTDATISIGSSWYLQNYTGITMSPHRHRIRFGDLNMSYVAGVNTPGFDIGFTLKQGTMQSLCRTTCKYSVHTGRRCALGNLGWAPIIIVEDPDFVQHP